MPLLLDETVNFSICFLFSFKFSLHLLCISLVPLIFLYSAQILLENALLCRQNARLRNRLLCSKFCRQNLAKPSHVIMFSVGRFTCKERVMMLIELEIRLLFCVNNWCFVMYKRETKFNGESRDFRETVISSFSAFFIGFRGS